MIQRKRVFLSPIVEKHPADVSEKFGKFTEFSLEEILIITTIPLGGSYFICKQK